jgi:hypothetical protein
MLIIQVEQRGVVGDRGIGRLQHLSSGSMMLYKGEAADVVGGCIRFMLVGGRRSCRLIVGMPGGQIGRVCSKFRGWGHGWVVRGQDKKITVGGGRDCWYDTTSPCWPQSTHEDFIKIICI